MYSEKPGLWEYHYQDSLQARRIARKIGRIYGCTQEVIVEGRFLWAPMQTEAHLLQEGAFHVFPPRPEEGLS